MALGRLADIPFCYDQRSGQTFGLTPDAIRLLDTLVGRTGGTSETIDAFDAVAPTTTKGDLIAHSGVKNVRQAVGLTGTFLRAESSSPTGITWGNAVTSVGLQASGDGIGVSGSNITTTGSHSVFAKDDLAAVEALSAYGLVARTDDETWEIRALTVNPAHFSMTDGDGVAGDPFLDFAPDVINELLPTQVANAFLRSDGTDTSFQFLTVADLPVRPSFSVHKNGTNQTGVVTSTFTKVTWSTAEWDTTSGFDFTNERFIAPAGKGRFTWSISLSGSVDQTTFFSTLYKNGVRYKDGGRVQESGTGAVCSIGNALSESDGTDYYELWVWQDSGVNQAVAGGAITTYFEWIWESN